MRYLVLIGCIIMVVLTSYLIVKKTDPHLFLKLQVTFGILGNDEDIMAEAKRMESINILPISDEKKEILNNRTIFMGATMPMVRLALGKPMQENVSKDGKITYWDYHLDEDIKATRLKFVDNKLVEAKAVNY